MTCSLQKIAQHWMQSGHQTEASFVESGARISLLLTARVRISSSAELTSDQRDPVRPGRRQTQAEMPPRCRGGFLRLFKPRQGEPGKPRKKARMARGSRPPSVAPPGSQPDLARGRLLTFRAPLCRCSCLCVRLTKAESDTCAPFGPLEGLPFPPPRSWAGPACWPRGQPGGRTCVRGQPACQAGRERRLPDSVGGRAATPEKGGEGGTGDETVGPARPAVRTKRRAPKSTSRRSYETRKKNAISDGGLWSRGSRAC